MPSQPLEVLPWNGLDIVTYDRLSVLLSEIIKLRSRGLAVMFIPHITIDLVRHQIGKLQFVASIDG